MEMFPGLSPRKRALLTQSLSGFDPRYDEAVSLLRSRENSRPVHATRESVFYALSLLLRQGPGDAERADRILKKVVSLQLISPGQLWHGTFASFLEQPRPADSAVDVARVTPEARWQGDILWERMTDCLRARLKASASLREHTDEIFDTLTASLRDVWPEVWETYDPNWREFILTSFALILENFEALLSPETVSAMENAAREGLKGARFRAVCGLTPMNTNVEVMHVWIFDAFGRRFGDRDLLDYAAAYAGRFMADYREHHAAAEFNSPTYNGVVLSCTGLLRTRGFSPAVRDMGEELEAGLWADFADFYQPAMGDLCGPWSRAYGLGIRGTAFPMLLYLGLSSIPEDRIPPFSGETESACLLCLSEPRIPETVQRLLTEPRGERTVLRQFRELAERGDPLANRSLCTATAWISDTLMLGAIRGSTNTSHQLHACTALWRNPEGTVSGLRFRRRTEDGVLRHQRTVFQDWTAEKNRLSGCVRNDTAFPVVGCLEIESPGALSLSCGPDGFEADGLRCAFAEMSLVSKEGETSPAVPELRPVRPGVLWLCVPIPAGGVLRADLRLSVPEA